MADSLQVYSRVYDVLREYMEKENVDIPFEKEVFMLSIGHKANYVDMKEWSRLEGANFINAAYLELLRRFPLPGDVEYWSRVSDYKMKLVNTILESAEFFHLHIEVVNNPYPTNQWKIRFRKLLYGDSVEALQQKWYYKLYMKLPGAMRKFAKKIVGI